VRRALRSPFEIDIYGWLTWGFFRLRRTVTISWAALALQPECRHASPVTFKEVVPRLLAEHQRPAGRSSKCLRRI